MMKSITLFFVLVAKVSAQLHNDTYQQTCELPKFEWAAYGTRLTGRMYTRRAAVLDDSLYAAGYLKSTNAPNNEDFVDIDTDFGVTGPYTESDPTGDDASFITSDLISYTTEHGSFAQYEVGVVKIDRNTGEPKSVFVYYGKGQDETCGLAAKKTSIGSKVLAVSGHFVGSLRAERGDGTTIIIHNSNAEGTSDFVLHPNAIKNGFDDGFVISADADNGFANWLVRYPESTKDAQTVGVDVDADGNVYGAGYACNLSDSDETICNGFVAKFSAVDGAVVWEQWFTELGTAMWLVYDETDHSLYVTGSTSYKGGAEDSKLHTNCNHDVCAVTMRLSAQDGNVDWVRTLRGSPRWNFFDQSGDIRLASINDGPYIYVALDDAGENGNVTLDEGTPYAGCLDIDNEFIPEYLVDSTKVVTQDDCPAGSTYISRNDSAAFSAFSASTDTFCGQGHSAADACIIKYHKFTGLPVWGTDMPPVASLVPSPDGLSVMAVGFYYPSWGHFDSVLLPDYNGIEGAYNAKLDAATGRGEYVMHSGGVGKDRPYDAVGSPEGDIYIVGYTQSAVINWGGSLQTKIIEEGIDQNDDVGTAFQMGKVSSSTSEYQFFATKLATGTPATSLSCVSSCSLEGNIAKSVIGIGKCLIDNVCYNAGATAELFGRPCQVCNPDISQTEWVHGATVGTTECFIDNVCRTSGEFLTFRESRSVTHTSFCQVCTPELNSTGWSVDPAFKLALGENPPNDCINLPVVTSEVPVSTEAPIKSEDKTPSDISNTSMTAMEEESLPGGCYDQIIHECGCQMGYCSKEMCESKGRIWADGAGGSRPCPQLCDPEVCEDAAEEVPMEIPVDYTPSESPTITRGGCYNEKEKECSCAIDRCMMSDCEAKGFDWVSIDQCMECAPVSCRADRLAAASTAAMASLNLFCTFVVTAAVVIITAV